MKQKKTTHVDAVKKFTAKFHTAAVRFYNKVDQLTPHEGALAWVAWRRRSKDADLFYAWALASHFALSSDVIWYNEMLSACGFIPDTIQYTSIGCREFNTGLQFGDVDDAGKDQDIGFAVYLDGKQAKLKGSTFGAMLHDASFKLHAHALDSAMCAVREAQRLADLF